MSGFYLNDTLTLEYPMPTLYYTSTPMGTVIVVPPIRPGMSPGEREKISVAIRLPKSNWSDYHLSGLLHMGIHIMELNLFLFPVFGEQLLVANRLEKYLSDKVADPNELEEEHYNRALLLRDRRLLLTPIIFPLLEIPAYITQMLVQNVKEDIILGIAEKTQQEQNINLMQPLEFLIQWARDNVEPTNHWTVWAPYINNAIMFGLTPNISAAALRDETTRIEEFEKDILEMIVNCVESAGPAMPHPFTEFPSYAYTFFHEELHRRGFTRLNPWDKACTLDDYVRIVRERSGADGSSWARSVYNLAGYIGTQESLPMLALHMFPYLAVEVAADDNTIVKEVSYKFKDKVVDPATTPIVRDFIALRATQEHKFGEKPEPVCEIKAAVGYKPASVRVNGANCHDCTGRFGSNVGLQESCDIAKIVRERLPDLFNGIG